MARQNGGSVGHGNAPPALGLPAITTSSTASPMPMIPVSAWSASVSMPTEMTTRAPSPAMPQNEPGSAPSTGPTMSAPRIPPAMAYSAMAPVRMRARRLFDGLAPALIVSSDAHRYPPRDQPTTR